MELVLTRLKDFSLKSYTFNDCKSAEVPSFRNNGDDEEESRQQKLDIEGALAWLRKELMDMRSQDQVLIKQLMELHSGIQELKQECTDGSDVDSKAILKTASIPAQEMFAPVLPPLRRHCTSPPERPQAEEAQCLNCVL